MDSRLDVAAVTEFCRDIAQAFINGDLERIPSFYIYPLTIYMPEGIRVEVNSEETVQAAFDRRSVALASGVRNVEVRVHSIDPTEDDRFTVRLDWVFQDGDGRQIGLSELRYFCQKTADGECRIAMLEFLSRAFPQSPDVWMSTDARH